MKNTDVNAINLITELTRRGYKARLVPISSLPVLQQLFSARFKSADLLIRRYLSFIQYQPPKTFPNPRSVLVLAINPPVAS
jgi:hypothetical protein